MTKNELGRKPGVGTLFCEVPGGKYFWLHPVQLFCGIPAVVAAATESS